jgi:CrcB protein
MIQKLLLLMLAGAMGTLARYGLSGLVQRMAGADFPWGTVAVNLTGCFLAGLAWTLAEYRLDIGGQTRAILLIGFMGAFTTFSTYVFETSAFLRDAEWLRAFGNVALQNVIGVVAVFGGYAVGRMI